MFQHMGQKYISIKLSSPVRKVIAVMPRRPTFRKHTIANTFGRNTALLPPKLHP